MRQTHQFSQTKRADIPRSSFDLSHGLKTTFDAGLLVPILSLEVLPGDTINCRASLFGRLATPIKPVLDNLYLESFFFFTPYRQVWENWEKFNGEQVNPGSNTDFTIPRLADDVVVGERTLYDYMGIPPGTDASTINISALPFRCFNHIFNFWFRDQNFVVSTIVPLGDGPDSVANYLMRRRRKRRDYLTSCLPFPQKGEAVVVPLGDRARIATDVVGNTDGIGIFSTDSGSLQEMTSSTPTLQMSVSTSGVTQEMYADLTTSTGVSINDLRESFQIQKLLERDARGGTRYPEILKSHFGVTDPQMLVHQRPEYLGGGSTMLNITPVQQQSSTVDSPGPTDTPQGNLAAYATVSAQGHGFTASFTEHGHIIGLVNVRADLTYQQGLERYWSRATRFDFYWPALSHLGEQAVLNKEIFISGLTATDDAVFGYMPRYDEYRFKQSQITSLFRSDATASLDVWHLAQDFAALPALNQAFIEDDPPIDRVVAVPSEPDILLDVYFKIRAARPLPLYATPGLIDHF